MITLGFFILFNVFGVFSQNFTIGFLNQTTLSYVQNLSRNPRIKLELVIPPPTFRMNVTGFRIGLELLQNYHAIIGTFNYDIAVACVTLKLAYFVIDEQINRNNLTSPLLDMSLNTRMMGGALNFILKKYNWIQNIRFVSDTNANAMDILLSMVGQTVPQCHFRRTDNALTISQCLEDLHFLVSPGAAYIVVTNDDNTDLLESIMNQFIYRSLPHRSFIFLPMMNTANIMVRYHYAGGVLYSVKPNNSDTETSFSFINNSAFQSFLHFNNTITGKVLTNINSAAMLQLLKNQNQKFTTDGSKTNYRFYWKVLKNMTTNVPDSVASIDYNGTAYTIPETIADPTFIGALDVINTLLIYEVVFGKNDSGDAQYITDSLNSLLLPLKLSYTVNALNGVKTIGRFNGSSSTGMMLAMFNNRSDMTAFPVPIYPSYLTRFVFSRPVYTVSYSILMKKHEKTLDLLRLVKPYSPLVWIMILVTVAFVGIILWLTNLISSNLSESTDKLSFSNSIFMVIGSLLMAKMLVKPNMISTQIFYLLIWLVTLLIIASYVGNLCVSIAFQSTQLIPFTTLAALLNQSSIKWVFLQDSILHNQIMNDIDNNVTDSIYVKLFNHARSKWNDKYLLNSSTNLVDFVIKNPTFGLLNDYFHNFQISSLNCNITTLSDPTANITLAYMMQPWFKYHAQVQQRLIEMDINGILDSLENKYFLVGNCPTPDGLVAKIQPLHINDMAGIFILIAIGILIAFPASFIEYLLDKSKLQCQRTSTGNSLKFGQVYTAKVKGLDKNGVTVDMGRLSFFSNNDEGRYFYVPKKYLGAKRKGDREILAPTDQGIMIGTRLLLKYMGNNPLDSKRIFVQVHKK